MKKKHYITCGITLVVTACIAIFLLCGKDVTSPILQGATPYAVVNSSSVNFREAPGVNSKVIDTLQKGNQVVITDIVSDYVLIDRYYGKWCKIEHNEKQGYVLSAFLDAEVFPEEKFHIFFDAFYARLLRKEMPADRLHFPVIDQTYINADAVIIEMLEEMSQENSGGREAVILEAIKKNDGIIELADIDEFTAAFQFLVGEVFTGDLTKLDHMRSDIIFTQSFYIRDGGIWVNNDVHGQGLSQWLQFILENDRWYLKKVASSLY